MSSLRFPTLFLTPSMPHPLRLASAVSAAMIVDVSGFTKMCEEFSKGLGDNDNDKSSRAKTKSIGEAGNEELTANAATFATTLYRLNNEAEAAGRGGERVREVLEAVMGGIIHVVDEYGGDVLRVAGDAVIAVFHSGKKNDVKEHQLVDVCCRCAFECIKLLESNEIIEKIGRKMVLHIGISSGTLEVGERDKESDRERVHFEY